MAELLIYLRYDVKTTYSYLRYDVKILHNCLKNVRLEELEKNCISPKIILECHAHLLASWMHFSRCLYSVYRRLRGARRHAWTNMYGSLSGRPLIVFAILRCDLYQHERRNWQDDCRCVNCMKNSFATFKLAKHGERRFACVPLF